MTAVTISESFKLPPNVTPAEFLLVMGVIAERWHRMDLELKTYQVASWTYREWVDAAVVRGFAEQRRLRDAMRVGKSTPRGLRLAAEVVSHFRPDELQILMRRADLRNTYCVAPSLRAADELRNSPVFWVMPRPTAVLEVNP